MLQGLGWNAGVGQGHDELPGLGTMHSWFSEHCIYYIVPFIPFVRIDRGRYEYRVLESKASGRTINLQ